MIRCQGSQRVNFQTNLWVLVGGLVSKQKLQKTIFFRYSVDGKKIRTS